MPTYRMIIEYDGTDWHGWQSQPDSITIQDELERALQIALRRDVSIVGSGRTDSGVHARGQVAHMYLDTPVNVSKLMGSLNGILPSSISVMRLQSVHDTFHARFDASLRSYAYHIAQTPSPFRNNFQWMVRPGPDIARMNIAAEALLGSHDFSAFCKTGSETKNRTCTVSRARWFAGESAETWVFRIDADRFLHGMVRAIVGTLIEIGLEKREAGSLSSILESRDRCLAGRSAPARGLVLERVTY